MAVTDGRDRSLRPRPDPGERPAPLPWWAGHLARGFTFDGLVDGREHLAFALGDWARPLHVCTADGPATLVRRHSECMTGDVFGSQDYSRPPTAAIRSTASLSCGPQSLRLRQEGRGIGLYAKLDA